MSSLGHRHRPLLEYLHGWPQMKPRDFLGLLGLNSDTGDPSHPKFTNQPAVKELYNDTQRTKTTLAVDHSMTELERLALKKDFRDNLTVPLLALYGDKIWGTAQETPTQRELRLDNDEHKKRIEVYLCCWLFIRAKAKNEAKRAAGRVVDLSSSLELDDDLVDSSQGFQTLVSQPTSGTGPRSRCQAPVAMMYDATQQAQPLCGEIPTPLGVTSTSVDYPTIQSGLTAQMDWSEGDMFGTENYGDTNDNDPDYHPNTQKRRRNNMGATKSKKLPKVSHKKGKSRAVDPSSHHAFVGPYLDEELGDALYSPNFPSLSVRNGTTNGYDNVATDQEAFENIPLTTFSVHGVQKDMPDDFVQHGLPVIPRVGVEESESAVPFYRHTTMSEETGSKEHFIQPPINAREHDTISANPRGVESPAAADDLRPVRQELTVQLMNELFPGTERPANIDYGKFIQLLNQLWDVDEKKLCRDFGDSFTTLKTSFQTWVDMHDQICKFRRMSNFSGRIEEWNVHCKTLESASECMKALKAQAIMAHWMTSNLSELDSLSGDLAKSLHKLSEMPDWVKIEHLKEYVLGYNQKLVNSFS
ncbi:hypothetical protein K505DRAFT_415215 [Melanomma pulvis-pyrius CBS 109.77]|uniref:Uncharacterized protein n=1 Tax=Melanomma pulvis-pyrius CBS 109.77 TaxID=1314802 RepID=A0A6A6XNP1_9PLEO|nr:hypothetical protein K505DRAFT_415215 [Melanomma pulvis-pyrius CBS 109.77]